MGQGKFTTAPIDESVGLLNKINKNALENIRSKHPEFSSILELGVIGGEKDINEAELIVRVEVSKVTLEETLKQTKEKYLPHFRNKLRKLQKIELSTQIIIVIGSSAVLGALLNDIEDYFKYAAYIGAVLTLIGALLTIILKKNSSEWTMNNLNIANSFNSLVNHRIKAEEILREITILSQFSNNNNSKELINLVYKCNLTNREIRKIIDKTFI